MEANILRMNLLVLCLSATIGCSSCNHHHPDLHSSEGHHHPELHVSEGRPLEPQEKFLDFYKPDLSHYIAPFLHPWTHKIAAFSYIKPTVTSTKTVVLQTIRSEKKHLICFKARHDLPPCLPDSKEDNLIQPTAVPEYPAERQTQFLGYLEGSEIKQQVDHYSQEREQRHLFGYGFFKKTEYVTNTLWVTKVEDYINTQVTATLIAANCIPCHANIPPCPEKVEHYVHYDLSHESKPVWEKKPETLPENSRVNSKDYVLENRSGGDANIGSLDNEEEKVEHPDSKEGVKSDTNI